MSWSSDFDNLKVNRDDPNPWLALYLDDSVPMNEESKRCLLRGTNSPSRRFVLPLIRPFARLGIILVKLLRMVIPEKVNSSRILHQTIYIGLKHFVQRDANY